jgi:hypothetical protein
MIVRDAAAGNGMSGEQPSGGADWQYLCYEQTIKEFVPASWFHPVGVFKVLARIWERLADVGDKAISDLHTGPDTICE